MDEVSDRRNTFANLAEVLPSTRRETRKVAAIGTGYSGSTLDKVDRIRDVGGPRRIAPTNLIVPSGSTPRSRPPGAR